MELYELSIKELHNKLVNREISAVEVVNYYISRIIKYGFKDKLNAVCALDPRAVAEASRLDSEGDRNLPLFGIPFLVKDNTDVKGLPTTCGSIAMKDNIAEDDAPVIKRLQAAGAIVLGKTNTSELSCFLFQGQPGGYSSYAGQVINAYDKTVNPSGSSTGSAVGVSAGLAPFALGSDTAFSIVGCAAVNGVFGYKPCQNNVQNDQVFPCTHFFDTVGAFAKRFEDLIYVLNVLLLNKPGWEQKANDEYSLAVNINNVDSIPAAQRQAYEEMIAKLSASGIKHANIDSPSHAILIDIMKRDYASSVNKYLSERNAKIKSMKELMEYYHVHEKELVYPADILDEAVQYSDSEDNEVVLNDLWSERDHIKEELLKLIEPFDGVLMTSHNRTIHLCNLPCISIPFKYDGSGAPKNMIVYATSEEKLLGMAAKLVEFADKIDFPADYR